MGGHHSTRRTLTFDDVQRDLQRELLSNARSMLSGYGVWVSDSTSLEDILQKIAYEQFKRSYGYEYHASGWQCRPPKSTGDNRPIDKMCNIATPIGSQVEEYLRAGVFSKLDLPSWMEQHAKAELSSRANDLVRWDTGRQWRYSTYNQTFDAKAEDSDSFICDSVLVYVNGSLTEDGIQAHVCIIYFMGVYFKTLSPTKELRNTLQRRAYGSSYHPYNRSTPTDENQLQYNLEYQLKDTFRDYFGFTFDQIPPDSCRADGADHAFITKNSRLCYFPDLQSDQDIRHYVEYHIFSGLDITLPSVRSAALDNTVDEFKAAVHSSSSNEWHVHRLAQTYNPASPLAHPVHERGVIMFWHCGEYASNGQWVSVTYIHILTEFYETLPPEEQAIKSLFNLLCNNLRSRLQHPGHEIPSTDAIFLKDMLHEYAIEQFKQAFGFDYAGEHSLPPDRHGSRIRAYADLYNTVLHPPPSKAVEDWIDAELFKKDSLTFPSFANNSIWNGIRDTSLHSINSARGKQDWWFQTPDVQTYQNPSGGVGIKQYSMYVYAWGDMEVEGVTVYRIFVYYLGVFCGVQNPSTNFDDLM